MGHLKVPTIYTIADLEGEEGLVVRLKAVRIGKLRKLIKLTNLPEEDLETALDEIFALLLEGLVSWNLETLDDEGQRVPVPTTMAGLEEQELPLIIGILNRWIKEMTGVDEDLGKDSPSGGSFPGQPLTMEAL
ncbi:MAG TPA: hypothetical protein VLA89_05485 [Gemmatimonadales bacterium]|nr:hypothetical protein [Gemmatimonadales bacterium]